MGTALRGQPRPIHYAPGVSRCIDFCQFVLAVRAAHWRCDTRYRHGDASPCRYRSDVSRESTKAFMACSSASELAVHTRPYPRRNPLRLVRPRPAAHGCSPPVQDPGRCPCRPRPADRSRLPPARQLVSRLQQGPGPPQPAAHSLQPARWLPRWLCLGPAWSHSVAGHWRSWPAWVSPTHSDDNPSRAHAAVGYMRL